VYFWIIDVLFFIKVERIALNVGTLHTLSCVSSRQAAALQGACFIYIYATGAVGGGRGVTTTENSYKKDSWKE
jgi:hypothetical protein